MMINIAIAAIVLAAVALLLYRWFARSAKWQDAVDEAVSRGME